MPVTNYYTVNGRIMAEYDGTTQTDYIHDALGSVVGTVNSAGVVVNTYTYKPYGEQLAKTGSGADPKFGWVGSLGYRKTTRRFSEQYVRARHYGTLQGQWTTVDPLWPGEWQFCYIFGCPVREGDPSGMMVAENPEDGSVWLAGTHATDAVCSGEDPCYGCSKAEDLCKFIRAKVPGAGKGALAWVACCKGRVEVCVEDKERDKIIRGYPGLRDEILRCALQHELVHAKRYLAKKQLCVGPTSCGEVGSAGVKAQNTDECLGYVEEFNCMKKWLEKADCTKNPDSEACDYLRKELCKNLNPYSSGCKVPLWIKNVCKKVGIRT